MRKIIACAVLLGLMSSFANAQQQELQICFENLSEDDGFFLTPLWVGLHDGTFDLFNVGASASPGLEELAETGSAATLNSEFAAPGRLQSVATDPAGFGSQPGQPPVIDPGNTGVANITVMNPLAYRYFSFASMLIPSNDAFIGNGNPMGFELFDAAGNFNGPLTINITSGFIFDAGTELNDGLGAAFSANGGIATDTMNPVTQGPDLSNFFGTNTAAGTTIGSGPASPLARITVKLVTVPEPASFSLLGIAGMGLLGLRRRRR